MRSQQAAIRATQLPPTVRKTTRPARRCNTVSGRKLNANDLLTGARVCIFSVSAAKAIFGGQSPIGESIHVGANRLTVVGVFDPEGGTLLNSIIGDAVIAPYTTVHDMTAGPIDFLQFWLVDRSKQSESYDALTRSLKERHEPRSAYIIQDESQTLSAFNLVLLLVTACLAAIGAVSLVVAGIGIMNIMLVTVNERMREIGIRRAVGATRRAIVTQFLVESVVLSACGGTIGIALGLAVVALVASVIRQQLGSAPVPYVPLVTGSVGVLVIIGVLSGTYPALRASRMNPIDVLSQ
jgi:putative ABC transport system permease protein